PISGDSDLLAYEEQRNVRGELVMANLDKLTIVQSYQHQNFRIIDLKADVPEGELPLYDLYRKHGKIVFQLYAACSRCNFTPNRRGIHDVGFKTFVALANKVKGKLSASSLAVLMWDEKEGILRAAGFQSLEDIENHLQVVVDVYAKHGRVYDRESNIIDMSGNIEDEATRQTKVAHGREGQ
ncbi:hypothetical protein ACHAWF_000882, partial [Thalassiosira exigua]